MSKKSWLHLLSFIGLFVTYGVAFGLDRWTEYLRQPDAFVFGPPYLLWSWALGNIVLAACVLSLYTWLMPKLGRWAIWFMVILGLLINFVPVIYWLPLGRPTMFLSVVLTRRGFLISVGGLTAIAGLITILRKRTKSISDF